MINYRDGVFETNSSSSHSICINNKKSETIRPDLKQYLDDNGLWYIPPADLEFYRYPFRILTTPEEKIRYAIACTAYVGKSSDEFKLIEKIVKELEPSFEHFVFKKSNWGCGYDMGGTDDAILFGWLNGNNIDLKTFITDNKYFIVCDGDEYNVFSDMILAGIIDKDIAESYDETIFDDY